MKKEEITALAREYAEFAGYGSNIDALVVIENAFGWLSQRYCLVEKEGLKKKYAELESEWMMAKGTDVYTALTKLEFFESLFPDIAKEVKDEKS